MSSILPSFDNRFSDDLFKKAQDYQSVCVIGLGYVGLPTALLYAQKGFRVHGVDINPEILSDIESNAIVGRFPELDPWWQYVCDSNTFTASAQAEPADIFLITVPTPLDKTSKACDMRAVDSAVKAILPVLQPGNIVILESTVPPGTTRQVIQPQIEALGFSVGEDIHLCFSPERILPGNTLYELLHNDRVLGGTTLESALLAKTILGRVIEGEIYVTDDITAEFCKLAENTYRDVNIALANELSLVADRLGINIHEALPIINRHPRVNLHQPGIGVGGHCIAVDPWFFVEAAPEATPLIATARGVNDGMPAVTVSKILKQVEGIRNPKIVLVGMTYKPNVADTRESPAIEIYEQLRALPVEVIAIDPLVPELSSLSIEAAAQEADLLVVLVNHNAVQTVLNDSRNDILARMRRPRIVSF